MHKFFVGLVALTFLTAPLQTVPQPQATATITGKVTDAATKSPLSMASVQVVGTALGATTNSEGAYRIERVPLGRVSLKASRVGYAPVVSGEITVDSARSYSVNITLSVQALILSGTTTTGIVDPASGARAPFSVTTVAGEKLDVAAVGSPLEALAGKVAGLQPRVATPGSDVVIQIRNPMSIAGYVALPPAGQTQPNITIDGVIQTREEQERQIACARTNCLLNTESYAGIVDNPFLAAGNNPLSTFSIDVDRASYSNVRRFVLAGQMPPKDAVRIEELINYFPYDYRGPARNASHPFSVTTEVAAAPWKRGHRIVRVGLQGTRLETATLPPSNLVFLIDVSGSMQPENKLPLVKSSLRMLVDQLREQDHVAIVVYAGSAGLVLEPTSGANKARILQAINRLEAGGSTAGGAGIKLAYSIARDAHLPRGNNRVILATDGDFNVGVSSDSEMGRLIEEERQFGTYLTVLGYGMGNYKDSKLETLADKGNGNYAYIDDIAEARKVLVTEMGGTLFTIAKDVKLQVEFNPARVQAYRLIGYENRALRSEDFANDKKDAGEMGAGHSVTALYEIIPVGVRSDVSIRGQDTLRYQTTTGMTSRALSNELMMVKLRYKRPNADTSILFTHTVPDRLTAPSVDFTFTTAVAALGMIMRDSEYKGTASLEDVIALAQRSLGDDVNGYRAEFLELARSYERLVHTQSTLTRRER